MDVVHKTNKPSKDNLMHLYDVCNQIFKSAECFYTAEEVKKEKEKWQQL